ncbi:MAG: hypothetical protein ACK57O_19100, partial [Planctomyces sp.]
VESSVQADAELLAPGQIQASGLVHLSGGSVTVDGIVQSQASRVLLNGVTGVDVTGQVIAAGDLRVHSGVNPAWSLTKLENSEIARSELSAGTVFIAGAGSVQSGGAVRVIAGGNLDVQSDASLGGGLTTRTRPIVTNVPQTVYVVTGNNQVATGTILVPEIRIVSTNITRPAGMDEFKICSVYYTMDVTLTQDGFYNPRAIAGRKQREYFVEGVDYFNSTDYPHTLTPGVPVIDWAAYGAPSVTSDYHVSDYRSFAQLTDVQRNAVMRTLGYLPLYNFSYSNGRKKQTIEGNPTDQPWTPDWDGKPSVIEYVQVSGWTDKYIRMPQGAAADVLRVVSQGVPEVGAEKVGTYRDQAKTQYVQDKSAAVETWGDVPEPYPNPGEYLYRNLVHDYDNSPARWQVDYVGAGNGVRLFTLTDGVTNAAHGRDPNWYWHSTTREENVYDVPIADAAAVAGTSGTGRYISVPDGYRSSLASVTNVNVFQQRLIYNVSNNVFYTPRRYWFNPNGGSLGGHHNAAQSMGGKVAEPRTMAQFFGAAAMGSFSRVGIMNFGSGWVYFTTREPVSLLPWGGGQPDGSGNTLWFYPVAYDDIPEGWGVAGTYQFEPSSYNADVNENFQDYYSTWTSIPTDVYDQRLTLTYQWVSNAHDIYGKRERFETVPVDVTVVGEKTVSQWGAAPISTPQTRLVSARSADPTLVESSEFGTPALLSASSLLIDVGGHALLRGTLSSQNSTLQLTAGGAMVLEGQLPESAPALAEVAYGELLAPAGISVAASSILVKDSARILVDSSANVRDVGVVLQASGAISLSGNVTSPTAVEIEAGTNVLL